MSNSRTLKNRINNIHHRDLKIDKKSNIEELLQKEKSVSVHMKNLQYLTTLKIAPVQ